MKPKIYVIKSRTTKDYVTKRNIRFAVVDLDKRGDYPANFICVLPQNLSPTTQQTSIFEQTFGPDRIPLAKKLLKQALQAEDDVDVKNEIRERLKQLEPKNTYYSRNRY